MTEFAKKETDFSIHHNFIFTVHYTSSVSSSIVSKIYDIRSFYIKLI